MWANRYHKPSAECNHLIGDCHGHDISPASVSADNLDNDPMPSEKELLIEAAKDDCQWPGQGTASMKKTSICKHSYEALVAAPMSELARQSDKIVNKADESTLMPCSPRDEHLALSTSSSPASPNNDLLSNKIICQFDLASLRTQKDIQEGELLIKTFDKLIRPEEEAPAEGDPLEPKQSSTVDAGQHSQNVVSMDMPNIAQCSPHASASPFLPMIRPIPPAEGSCQWLEHKPNLPFMKVLGDKEARPDQMAISEIVNSTRWHSQESAAAHMPPTNEPISRPPAYTLRSSPEHERRLRWKPPDYGGGKRRHACHVVNKKLKLSVITSSPKPLAAFLLITKPALLQVRPKCLPSLTMVQPARRKPPNGTGTLIQAM
jgi:hypothetical protein